MNVSVTSVEPRTRILNSAVVVSALGYFVDIYDLILFSIVRTPSLKALGVAGDALLSQGIFLLNVQMFGMLVGGIFWGVLGDKRGRLSVLFGSIVMYSLANLANGFVNSVEMYAVLRLIAGIGLAGELGAGITLVAESLPKHLRGYGTTLVAAFGICGAVLAAQIAEYFDWRTAYFIGGGLGLALLVLRVSVFESKLFNRLKESTHSRGDFLLLFKSRPRFFRYLNSILIGVPVWFVIGILITLSPEFASALGVTGPVSAGKAVMYSYMGLAVGDLASGLLSQFMKSRRKVVLIFLLMTFAFTLVYLLHSGSSPSEFYALCFALGLATGYWALLVTIGAEQFGTNLRSTVTTTVPNFVRGAVVPLSLAFGVAKGAGGIVNGALIVGTGTLAIALLALWNLEETFTKDLDFIEK